MIDGLLFDKIVSSRSLARYQDGLTGIIPAQGIRCTRRAEEPSSFRRTAGNKLEVLLVLSPDIVSRSWYFQETSFNFLQYQIHMAVLMYQLLLLSMRKRGTSVWDFQ